MKREPIEFYEDKARQVRIWTLKAINAAGSGHPGGSLSAADIMTALYFGEMNIDPKNKDMEGRDKFVLSKGHAAPAQYACLGLRGYYDVADILTLRKMGSPFQGHGNMKRVPGVEMSTGSLGQGFSVSVGMALAAKIDETGQRIYAMLGDGEIQEGLVWEAAMAASHHKLGNLTAILDYNKLQIDGPNSSVMTVAPVDEKFKSFGWEVIVIDGHDFGEIFAAFDKARENEDVPTMIIANTVKGKGVSYMEGEAGWHGKAPDDELLAKAIEELGGEE